MICEFKQRLYITQRGASPMNTLHCSKPFGSLSAALMNVVASVAIWSIDVAGAPVDAPMPRLSNVIT
jgi:hypothetical protein